MWGSFDAETSDGDVKGMEKRRPKVPSGGVPTYLSLERTWSPPTSYRRGLLSPLKDGDKDRTDIRERHRGWFRWWPRVER